MLSEDSSTTDEIALVVAAQSGDRAAFDALARRYRSVSLALAWRFLKGDAAEDAVQDTMLTAFRAIGQLEDPSHFAAWLAAILRNRCKRLARQRPYMASIDELEEVQINVPWQAALSVPPPPLPRTELAAAVQSLPPAMQQLVRLYYLDDLSVGEIAAFLSLPVTTIKWQLHAARAALRRKLGNEETL